MLPELFTVQRIAYEGGALMSTLSGSGSTFFSMVYDDDSNSLTNRLKQKFPDSQVKCLNFDNNGLMIER